jgi:hypothetical protein
VLCVSILIVNLDSTVLNVALPTLVRDLHATSHQLQWIVDAYALVYGGLVLVGGSLADRVGRKRTIAAGLLVIAGGLWQTSRAAAHPGRPLGVHQRRGSWPGHRRGDRACRQRAGARDRACQSTHERATCPWGHNGGRAGTCRRS